MRAAAAAVERSVPEAILAAVHDCFVRYGPEKTSIQDIASQAGVSRGTVYRYFRDRKELVATYVDWAGDRFLELARHHIARRTTLEEQIAELAVLGRSPGRALGAAFPELPAETMALLLTVHSEPSLRKSIDFLIPYLREAKRRGEVRPGLELREAAEWIAHMLFTVIDMPALTFDPDDPAELRRFVRRYVVRGLA